MEVLGELVDPFVEFFSVKSLVGSSVLVGGFLNPSPVFFGWGVVSGLGESFEGSDELLFVNLTVVVGVNGGEDGSGFFFVNTLVSSFDLDGSDGGDESNGSEFHL